MLKKTKLSLEVNREIVKRALLVFLFLSCLFMPSEGQTWTGTSSTDWNNGSNWSTGSVPLATGDLVIPSEPANQPVISAADAVARTVEIQSGATLTIQVSGVLAVNGSKTLGEINSAFYNNGTVDNNGILQIGNLSNAGSYGLTNGGTFNNNSDGQITIDRSNSRALYNYGANFNNTGAITIGAVAGVGIQGIVTESIFNNNIGGHISIDGSTNSRLQNYGNFTNDGFITIGPLTGASYGLVNIGTFNNNTGGQITIDRSGSAGLYNISGTFTNAAVISLGATASVGNFGLWNAATFENNTGGQISIDRTFFAGLRNTAGSFTNVAFITIGATAGIVVDGLVNEATFNNSGCNAMLQVISNNIINGGSGFTNSGTVIENASGNSNINTNTGLVKNLNGGTFTITDNTGILTTDANAMWTPTWYLDADGDNYGDPAHPIQACPQPAGYVANNTDVDDNNIAVWQSATLYLDSDGDGYDGGQRDVSYGAIIPPGYSDFSLGSDCNDEDRFIYPGAVELCNDGVDNNCNGQIDEAPVTPELLVYYSRCRDFASFGVANYPPDQGFVYQWHRVGVVDPVVTDYGAFTTGTAGDYFVTISWPGCPSSAASETISIDLMDRGDLSVFGNNQWNVYSLGSGGWNQGYYIETSLSFNTQNRWDPFSGPGATDGFIGCDLGDNVGFTAKRKGFPCGRYSINIPVFKDEAALFINGLKIWEQQGWTGSNNVWEGYLGPDSKVEFYVSKNSEFYYAALAFSLINSEVVPKPVIAYTGSANICSLNSLQLTSSATSDNNWNTGATTQSITVNTAGSYYVTVTGEEGCIAQSDPVDVSVTPAQTFYRDADGDGYGNSNIVLQSCSTIAGYVSNSTDCNDNNAAVYPGAIEICDGVDNNCNGVIDEGFTNTDGDALADCVDPDDDNDAVLDASDCAPLDATKWRTGNFYRDADGDGYGTSNAVSFCYGAATPTGYATQAGDCNDANAAINPGVAELCDGLDNNCNGTIDEGCSITSCGVVTGLTTTEITSTSARLNWVSAVDPVQWQVQFKTTAPGSKWKDVIPAPGSTARTVLISGLSPNQNYQWHIKARCGKTWTSYFESVPFKTLPGTSMLVKSDTYSMPDEDDKKSNAIKLYPNPSNGKVTLELRSKELRMGNARIELVDMKGKTVYLANADIFNGAIQKTFTVSPSLSAGIYTVKVIAENHSYFSRLVFIK